MILAGLRRARRVVCVSDETQRQLVQLGGIEGRRISTIQNGLNYNYQRLKDPESSALLWEFPALQTLGERGFIFHVGGNQWYKNRAGVLRIYFEYVSQGGRLPLVMAGKPFTPELERLMVEGPSAAQVLRVGSVNNQQLNALYARAACLLFPSLQEGFGWPIVEAFAAGTRVVTTGAPPMNEIGGDVAVYIDPRNETAAGRALLELLGEPEVARQQREQRAGFWGQNFRPEAMLAAYQAVYAELAAT
jgi:glycosyltransferase involved in cell wall biosynthesis